MANPIPVPPPVTTATWFFSSDGVNMRDRLR
jgi:hypothetical protein